jgi:hypothetical protein
MPDAPPVIRATFVGMLKRCFLVEQRLGRGEGKLGCWML